MPSSPSLGCFLALATVALGCQGDQSAVVPPPVDAGFGSLSAGLVHTCGVTVTNKLYCWGWNRDGAIGDGSHTDRVYAVRIGTTLSIGAVNTGGGHSCALTSGGVPYCWGLNLTGQVGDGSTASKAVPTAVAGGLTLSTLASGGTFTCGLVAADSSAYCWGWGRDGELGSRPTETCPTDDGPEPCSRTPIAVSGVLRFVAIVAGIRHTCALVADSTAYCWGRNDAGQLGNGTTTDTAGPVVVSGGYKFAALTAGFSHTCGLTAAGDAYCWGDNSFGQVGALSVSQAAEPMLVGGGVVFREVSAGSEHTCGVSQGNAAWCWGYNGNNELGTESLETCTPATITVPCSHRPVAVTTTQSFASISGGGHHTCAVTTGGRAYCWGNNSNGQLGTGNRSGSSVPVVVANQP